MKTITITEENYAVASGTAMRKFVDVDDGEDKMFKAMLFLVVQGLIFSELFNEEEETYNA